MKKMKFLVTIIAVISAMCCFADTPQPPSPSAPDGSIGGYDYVDLGLPSGTLWATYNVGASSPYEYGDYFAWGEVEPRDYFTWDNYKFNIEYVFVPEIGSWYELQELPEDISGTEYDAARQIWGNGWRMPNEEERYELRMHCWHRWTEENGVCGVRVYGPNEHSIFLPACGGKFADEPDMIGVHGYYWTGVEDTDFTYTHTPIIPSNRAKDIQVDSGGLQSGGTLKPGGKNIRAVINLKGSSIGTTFYDMQPRFISCKDGIITLNCDNVNCTVQVTDLYGRTVFVGAVDSGSCTLPTMSNGVYLVTISDGDTFIQTQKVIIK